MKRPNRYAFGTHPNQQNTVPVVVETPKLGSLLNHLPPGKTQYIAPVNNALRYLTKQPKDWQKKY